MQRHRKKFNFTYFVFALFAVMLLQELLIQKQAVKHVSYSRFNQALDAGHIKEVVVSGDKVKGVLRSPIDGKNVFTANLMNPDLVKTLEGKNVEFRQEIQSTFLRDLLSWVVPMVFFVFLWIFISRKMMGQSGGSFMSVGKSKAKIYVEKGIKTTFKDVAGVDEAKDELEEVINFLKSPEQSGRLGAKLPKGILLVGPPGTGKTLLAKAVAGEAQVPFFSISGSEFVEMFVGVGAARVRDLFEQARSQAPCIIFIDELDALGKARGFANAGGGHDEKEQTLNQLLVELDGFDAAQGVVLLAATNRPEVLDPALLRAGRFDRQVLVDRPDKTGRIQILKVHSQKIKIDPSLDLEEVAALTTGFTGADLANLVNEAALSATRAKRETVELEDFNIAIERILAGLEKRSRVLNEKERSIVAYHEMGHAFVAAALPGSDKVHKVSIIPRGVGALGYTIQRPTEDRYLMSSEELENKMAVLLGGRASEKLFFDSISTGSSDDVARATEIARSMVARYAMIEELGHVAFEDQPQRYLDTTAASAKRYSEKTTEAIDEKIQELTDQAFKRAYSILELNRELVEGSARELLEKETLSGAELQERFAKLRTKKRGANAPL